MAVSHPKADWASGLSRRPLLARGHPLRPRSRRALAGGAPATRLGGRALTRLTRRGPRARVRAPAARAVLLPRPRRAHQSPALPEATDHFEDAIRRGGPWKLHVHRDPDDRNREEATDDLPPAGAIGIGRSSGTSTAQHERPGGERARGTCGGRTTRATPVVGGAPSRGCSRGARRDASPPCRRTVPSR